MRRRLVDGTEPDAELVPLEAELDALAASEGIDAETAKELLLRLRERGLRRELASADLGRTKELQAQLDEGPGRGVRARLTAAAARIRLLPSPVAQLAEHPAVNRRVTGSSPVRGVSSHRRGSAVAVVAAGTEDCFSRHFRRGPGSCRRGPEYQLRIPMLGVDRDHL